MIQCLRFHDSASPLTTRETKTPPCEVRVDQSNKGLASLTDTKTMPLSPLEIRRSSSRYVITSHAWELSARKGNLRGGCPDITLVMEYTAVWRDWKGPWNAAKSNFWPRKSMFSGISRDSINWGASMTPSSSFICKRLGLQISKDAFVLKEVFASGPVKVTVLTRVNWLESIVCEISPTLTKGKVPAARKGKNPE